MTGLYTISAFHLFGPNVMKLLLPDFSVLEFLTAKSKGQTIELALDVKIVFMKLEFSSLIY